MLEEIFLRFKKIRNAIAAKVSKKDTRALKSATVIARGKHGISRKQISRGALDVLYKLHKAGFQAFIVGGGVRDLLLGKQPKDFDIATNATPAQVRRTIRNSRVIGRRFQIVHVYFQNEIVEVSTFRGGSASSITEFDNTFGTIEQDAWRRDFTINALYYSISDFAVYDFMNAMDDIKAKKLVMIGDVKVRFHEDPIRILRAIRLAAKLPITLDKAISAEIPGLSAKLLEVPQSRLFDELVKLFLSGGAQNSLPLLIDNGLLKLLFPGIHETILHDKNAYGFVEAVLATTDDRLNQGKSVNPGYLIASMLWPYLQFKIKQKMDKGLRFSHALSDSVPEVVREQISVFPIPKRFLAMLRSVWMLQYHFERRRKNRVQRVLHHRYFRAGVDFLKLRAELGEVDQELADWWFKFHASRSRK